MSSATQTAGHDAPVTVKIFYDGATRRAKMPLREMAPQALEQHVRTFLQIPDDGKMLIERYSDSAAAYVLLDSANVSIYKQLYRAAKAKGKLKLRVTVLNIENRPSVSPASTSSPAAPASPVSAKGPHDDAKSPVGGEAPVTVETQSPAPTLPMPSFMTLPLRGSCPHGAQTTALPTESDKPRNEALSWNSAEFQHRLSQLQQRLRATSMSRAPETVDDGWSPPVSATSKPTPRRSATGCNFAVCCNSCERTILDAHYHCSICDDGDFDLCQACLDHGITCYNNNHWLIRRVVKNGQLVNSTTETIAPKSKAKPDAEDEARNSAPITRHPAPDHCSPTSVPKTSGNQSTVQLPCVSTMRTCNCCVLELPEREFLHCAVCEDFDLCQPCFAKDNHGHHPKHGFVPTVAGVQMPDHIKIKMSPGRNQMHHAICDGCDKYIAGVRHKCLDCPDWDYCSECIHSAHFVHADHRFVPIYEPLAMSQAWPAAQPIHTGICCDGPLCSISQAFPSYIRGVRYKCAVCHDLDFCANCEASPANTHNKTHPLIKFKTPVRHVSVTTTGEHQDGKRMPAMGDRSSTKTMETMCVSERNSINAVQTVVDVKPLEALTPAKPEAPAVNKSDEVVKETPSELEVKQPRSGSTVSELLAVEKDLRAVFVRDSVEDGTILAPNHVFEQTWILRNEGTVAWPPGCSVKFVGGDYMGHVDSNHPACISELVSASESTVCYAPLAPGQEFSFTVLLRTPPRSGKVISYWRLTTNYGHKFGHRLWCEVNVRPTAEPKPLVSVLHIEDVKEHASHDASSHSSSTMVFPKLAKESPRASVHEEESSRASQHKDGQAETEPVAAAEKPDAEDGFEGCGEDEFWDGSDEGFLTDEEYDILDASDEEFLEQQQLKKPLKK
ncbi:hypothetical protein XA68_16708 [Ophiocordyceps unilateralis]|uniref:ZZ-type domain-containing protein n=1 Tax=Ophiocordyceps unilateralis TaxID=268505 RepID=A0A2A9P574_OPHUN|nr:hypothetical protein XA68_16708 [Ophiocordyceps unilateralis]